MLEIIYHGHSFIQIVQPNGSILIDPFITNNPACDIKLNQININDIKAIILTHGHQDHIGDSIEILKLNPNLHIIATFELANYLQHNFGGKNISAMHIGGEADFGDYKVKFVSAVHGGHIDGMNSGISGLASGVVVRTEGKSIYHAGDTALHYDMKLLGEYDKIDLAFLPIGGHFTMGIDDAVIATGFVNAKTVVPIHYNTWEVIAQDPIEFARKVMTQTKSVPKVLNPGQKIVY